MADLLLSFFGDDFTGSTDAMESLARGGVRTVLFTKPPTPRQLAQYDGLRAFGVAGMTRSMPPEEIEQTLRPTFAAIKQCAPPIVHYKVCSTFDSSPTVGSIGRAIDVGVEVFGGIVPVVVGAPSLRRYCVFGNLFVRNAGDPEPIRIDRHPSMSRHPTTPMNEADLRLHLSKQTTRTIGLIDVLKLGSGGGTLEAPGTKLVLIDLLDDTQLPIVGRLIAESRFVVGSSGVESALMAHWNCRAISFPPVQTVGPIVAVCGSCSPVTAAQIRHALASGFDEAADLSTAADAAIRSLRAGRSVVIHTGMGEVARRVPPGDAKQIGPALGRALREILESARVRRVIIAGGDTSGQVASALGIESMEMTAELTRGAPLCRVTAPDSPADGVEFVFKGGQIGKIDFFTQVEQRKTR